MASLPIDSGLLARFRAAGAAIHWRVVRVRTKARRRSSTRRTKTTRAVRVAHLNDEEARVERRANGPTVELTVDSGPVGALVLVLEMDLRGLPQQLTQHPAKKLRAFPSGALTATWTADATEPTYDYPVTDLIRLARFALA